MSSICDLPAAYAAALQRAEQTAFHHVLDEADSPDWVYKATKRGITVHAQPAPGSVICRGLTTISHPLVTAERICALSAEWSAARMEYDTTLTCDKQLLATYGPSYRVARVYANAFPATTRDFVALFHTRPIPADDPRHQGRKGWYVIGVGVDHSAAPPESKYVRATLNWNFTYCYETPQGLTIHYANNVRVNGLLPTFITNHFALSAPLEVANWIAHLKAGKGQNIAPLVAPVEGVSKEEEAEVYVEGEKTERTELEEFTEMVYS